jgi:SAM-dependent methyltransferase
MTGTALDVGRLVEDFAELFACPLCAGRLALAVSEGASCGRCNQDFPWLAGTWDLVPPQSRESSELWSVWDQLQANGLVSYREDPEHNLAVGDRADCKAFGEFCAFDGRVVDVGCGPQDWPAYFSAYAASTRFVGVDPLIEQSSPRYLQLRAVAEHLPFRSGAFDHVVFATSLDHFVDPTRALVEARRTCKAGGEIDIWIGEKQPGAPAVHRESPEWYRRLTRPEGSEDVFHVKRLSLADVTRFVDKAGLSTRDHEVRRVDDFRTNHFFRLGVQD